jgi:hypothetical protein
MNPGVQIGLVAVVFASQIFVLSFFMPDRRRHFLALLVDRYPPREYPRLYPVPQEQMQRRLALFKPFHWAIGLCSAIALLVGLIHGTPALQLARSMLTCLLLQLLPHYAAIPTIIGQMKALRAMPPPSVRAVELRQWRIVDFVSPLSIVLGLCGQGLALGCSVVAYQHRPQALPLVGLCVVVSSALLLRMIYLLLSPIAFKRADRYMSAKDMFRVRRRRLRTLFGSGAALGAYFALALLNSAQLIRFDIGYMIIGVSIVTQLLGLYIVAMQRQDLETRDFSVYRADGPLQPAS